MRVPAQCAYWKRPDLAFGGPVKDRFDLLERLIDEDHWRRYLLRCRECGQRYFYEFYEEIDWKGGEDAQRSTLIPVETDDEFQTVRRTPASQLKRFSPRLERLFPTDAERPTTTWVTTGQDYPSGQA